MLLFNGTPSDNIVLVKRQDKTSPKMLVKSIIVHSIDYFNILQDVDFTAEENGFIIII